MSPPTPAERSAIVNSLRVGVTPSLGLQHIQVGRGREISAVLADLTTVKQDGSAVRFIIGDYGSGKTFFLQLLKSAALAQKFVVVQADITLDRKLHGTGSGRALYRELIGNMATSTRPDGGALAGVIERWISETDRRARKAGGKPEDVPQAIEDGLVSLRELPHGYDFALVLRRYYEGFRDGNAVLQDAALKWLRAEYEQKTVARRELNAPGLGTIDDSSYFDALKLFARFVALAGFSGLLVNVDELGVLATKVQTANARKSNYEVLLTIVNECSQGRAHRLMCLFACVSDFVENRDKGLYSHDALESRLAPPRSGNNTVVNYASPVIRLDPLTPEDRYLLLENVRRVHDGDAARPNRLTDEGLKAFFAMSEKRLGSAEFDTVRDAVRALVDLLDKLEQHPDQRWQTLLAEETKSVANKSAAKSGLAGLKL